MNNTNNTPVVGMGCTVQSGSDRYAATVIEVNGSVVVIQMDSARAAGSLHIPAQGEVHTVRQRKNGQWRCKGKHGRLVSFGERDTYMDPSF